MTRFRPSSSIYLVVALMFAVLLGVSSLPEQMVSPALSPALFGVSVVIDAGHGDWDPGMVGNNSVEKDINLAVAKKLAEYCRAAGASVTLTRESDAVLADSKHKDMEERVALTKAVEADIFISLHCNSFVSSPSQHGAQVFYQKSNAGGEALAKAMQAELGSSLGNTDRSALVHPDSYLLRHLDCAAAICEIGFLSNEKEETLLIESSYQWDVAWAIFCGISDYLSAPETAKTTP